MVIRLTRVSAVSGDQWLYSDIQSLAGGWLLFLYHLSSPSRLAQAPSQGNLGVPDSRRGSIPSCCLHICYCLMAKAGPKGSQIQRGGEMDASSWQGQVQKHIAKSMDMGKGRLCTLESGRVDTVSHDPGIREHRALHSDPWPCGCEVGKAWRDEKLRDSVKEPRAQTKGNTDKLDSEITGHGYLEPKRLF